MKSDDNMKFDAKSIVASLTHRPGVYRMLNAKGQVIYVGKARDPVFICSDHRKRLKAPEFGWIWIPHIRPLGHIHLDSRDGIVFHIDTEDFETCLKLEIPLNRSIFCEIHFLRLIDISLSGSGETVLTGCQPERVDAGGIRRGLIVLDFHERFWQMLVTCRIFYSSLNDHRWKMDRQSPCER